MQPRAEVAIAFGALVILGLGAAILGARRNTSPSEDSRRSTFLPGPDGARAYAQTLDFLGIGVERYRGRLVNLEGRVEGTSRPLFAVLDPRRRLDLYEGSLLWQFQQTTGDLLLAGPATGEAMRCFGFDVDVRSRDTVPVRDPSQGGPPIVWIRDAVLARQSTSVVSDSGPLSDLTRAMCVVPEIIATDTLLVNAGGRPAAVRLHLDSGVVTLAADGRIFSNRLLKDHRNGVFALRMVTDRWDRVIFDEYHHGFDERGSLAAALWAWSLRNPWGWFAWQLALVGLVALAAAAIRFGPVQHRISRRRRSPLEHVRALARALSSAGGAGVAVDLMVRGLRRRLSPGGHAARGDSRAWLETIAPHVRSARAREAVATLRTLIRGPQPPDGVLRAAHAVEDVWQEFSQSAPKR